MRSVPPGGSGWVGVRPYTIIFTPLALGEGGVLLITTCVVARKYLLAKNDCAVICLIKPKRSGEALFAKSLSPTLSQGERETNVVSYGPRHEAFLSGLFPYG